MNSILKIAHTIILLCFLSNIAKADTIPIPQSNYEVMFVSSDNNNHPANHAFDADTTTWWALHNSAGYELPGIIILDLGQQYAVSGFTYLPNFNSNAGIRAKDFEFYVSNDTSNWGNMQSANLFNWVNITDFSRQTIQFGAINGRYVKLVYNNNMSENGKNIHTNDLKIFQSNLPPTGQQNQIITFETIPEQYTQNEPFELEASSSSGLPIAFEIVSGPASINGNILTLEGSEGIVTVKAIQTGDNSYYAAEVYRSFQVTELSQFWPEINTSFTDQYPIEMPELGPYPLFFNVKIDYSNVIDIENIEVSIDGAICKVDTNNGVYSVNWIPNEYKEFTIEISADASNGNSTSEEYTVSVIDFSVDQTVQTFNYELINYSTTGQSVVKRYNLPQFVGAYNKIIGHFSTSCPNIPEGCDDWDRLAHVYVKNQQGNWVEIIRYITPYGIGCNHQIDLTDYASILQGKVDFKLVIGTFGSGGWEVSLDLEYFSGIPEHRYSKVDVLWSGIYQFGDPANLQPVETRKIDLPNYVKDAKLKLIATGHGWGDLNTGNAAEFFHAVHHINIDESTSYEQDLWMDCDPNPDNCTGQLGTWYFNRAGWCPGAIAKLYEYNFNPFINLDSFNVSYIFQEDYIDLCHPNNPDCITGVTCNDCNSGFNPHYSIDANLITYFDSLPLTTNSLKPEANNNEFGFNVSPNPSKGLINISFNKELDTPIMLLIHDVSGKILVKKLYENSQVVSETSINLMHLPSNCYYVQIHAGNSYCVRKIIID